MENIGAYEMLAIVMLIGLIPAIFFLITQQNTLKAIQYKNRSMPPGEVWLQIIPIFGLVWQFIVVTRIANSIKKELAHSNQFSFDQSDVYVNLESDRPTYQIGIAYCILFCCSIIPVLGGLASMAGLVCWIVYWVKLSQNKNLIERQRYSVSPPSTP